MASNWRKNGSPGPGRGATLRWMGWIEGKLEKKLVMDLDSAEETIGWKTMRDTWHPWAARVVARRHEGVRWPMPALGMMAM